MQNSSPKETVDLLSANCHTYILNLMKQVKTRQMAANADADLLGYLSADKEPTNHRKVTDSRPIQKYKNRPIKKIDNKAEPTSHINIELNVESRI